MCVEPKVAISGQAEYQLPCWSEGDLARYSRCGDECMATYSSGMAIARHIGKHVGRDVPEYVLMNQLMYDDAAVERGVRRNVVRSIRGYGCDGMVCFDGPYLPHWVLHPVHCNVGVMKQLERWYFNGWIPRGLYTLWIEQAFPLYISDTIINSQVFWDTACDNITKYASDEKFKITEAALPVQDTVKYAQCQRWPRSVPHHHVVSFDAQRSSAIKWSIIFPPSCATDHTHQRVKMDAVWNMYVDVYGK